MYEKSYLDFISSIRQSFPASCSIFLQFSDFKVQVQTNSHEVKNGLQNYFQSFVIPKIESPDCTISVHQAPVQKFPFDFQVKPPDLGKSKIKEEFFELRSGRIVRKRLTGMYFIFGPKEHLAVGPCQENLNQVVNFINNRFIDHLLSQGALLGHAAGVQLNNQGLAIAGNSGSGKSSLALHLLNHGFAYTSNDRLLVTSNQSRLKMFGVAKMPRINPGTALHNPVLKDLLSPEERKSFLKMPIKDLWNLEQKYDVPIEKYYGQDRFILQGPLDNLIILNWKHTSAPPQIREFSPESRPELIKMFQIDTGLFYYPEQGKQNKHSLKDYCQILKKTRLFEIYGGIDFDLAIELCFKVLKISN